jgi:hypothetical protein
MNPKETPNTSSFGMIAQMELALFPKSLQVVLKPPSNVKSCGTETLQPIPYWKDEKKVYIESMIYKNSYKC